MLDKFLPPTDNLYKFIAISGLMLLILSFVPEYLSFRYVEKLVEYENHQKRFITEIKAATNEREKLNERLNNYNEQLEKIVKDLNETRKAVNKKELIDQADEIIKNSNELSEYNKKLDQEFKKLFLTKNDLDTEGTMLDTYDDEIKYLKDLSRIIFIVGCLLIIFGFSTWYYKVQKPNDLILFNQATQDNQSKLKRAKRHRLI